MKNKRKYFEFSIPMVPKYDDGKIFEGMDSYTEDVKELKIRGFRGQGRISDAQKNFEKTNREYRDRYKKGDNKAVIELLEKDVRFFNVPWVREAWLKRGTKRGRHWGDTSIDRKIILELVDSLVEKGMNKDKAFGFLSDRIGQSSERIKALYYDAKKSLRYKPLLRPKKTEMDIEGPKDIKDFVNKIKVIFRDGGVPTVEKILRECSFEGYSPRETKKIVTAYIREAERLTKSGEFSLGGHKYKLLETIKKKLQEQIERAKAIRSSIGKGS
jgi:hypothetical protein